MKEKIEHSLQLIRKASLIADEMNPGHGLWVGFSGGKDSVCVLRLVQMAGVKYHAYYNVTGIDAPDSIYFIRDKFPEVTFIHPPKNYFRLVEDYCLPTMGRRFCCNKIKENTGAGHVVLTGVRAEESKKRAAYTETRIFSRRKEHGGKGSNKDIDEVISSRHQCIKGQDKLMVYPIHQWTEVDVWQFIADEKLPINPLYDMVGRVGCMFCPFASREQLEMYEMLYPEVYRRLLLAIERNIAIRGDSRFSCAEDMYDWWKSKLSYRDYMHLRGSD